MSSTRRAAFLAGAFYLLTVITSIPALVLKSPALHDPQLLSTAAGRTPLLIAVVLELVLALTCVGTAVALFPVLRRVQESLALGFVCARTVEAAAIGIGALALLSLADLVRSGSDGAAAMIAVHNWAFLLGPGLIPAVNALLLGPLLLRARLVPRIIPAVGVIGAPLLAASAICTITGLFGQVSTLAALAALPIGVWEISLGFWLLVKGFRPTAVELLAPTPKQPAHVS